MTRRRVTRARDGAIIAANQKTEEGLGPTTTRAKRPTAAKPAAKKPATGRKSGKLAYATEKTAPLVKGRRAFFQYRDFGVTAASDGAMRAQMIIGSKGMSEPTGWHYHVCDAQFVYGVKGWVDLEFETGEKIRLKQGESLMIPGGNLHRWATSQPGRCPSCGFHIKSQGCACAGQRLKFKGQATVVNARPADRAKVDAAIHQLAASGKPFSSNDAVALAVLQAAEHRRLVQRT
mgnify:CR=1 FL=1